MPRENYVNITNTGTASVNIGIFDTDNNLFLNSGQSYEKIGLVCIHPIQCTLHPNESIQFNVSITLRKVGLNILPFLFKIIGGTKKQKEWKYNAQATVEQPLINDHVFSILENENLLCLKPKLNDNCLNQFTELISTKPRNNVIINNPISTLTTNKNTKLIEKGNVNTDYLATSSLLSPIGPLIWLGPEHTKMKNYINIPEPLLPSTIINLNFIRKYDNRESIRFSDSIPKNEKMKMVRNSTKKSKEDQLWKSLRATSRTGLY